MKNFTVLLLLAAGFMACIPAQAQRSGAYPPAEGISDTDDGSRYTREDRPQISKESLEQQFERVRYTLLGQACSGDAVKTFSREDMDKYLLSFRDVPVSGSRVDGATARKRVEDMTAAANQLLADLSGAKQVSLVGQQVSYSDQAKVFEVIELTLEVFDKDNQPHLADLLLVNLNGEYKLLYGSTR